MKIKNYLKALFSLCFLLFVFFISCEEDSGGNEPVKVNCKYSTFNPSTADYTCADSGYIQVGNLKCCPLGAPYHCPSLGKCYTSCEAASEAGCTGIVYATTGGGGGTQPCDEPYNGPTGDIQSDSFCQAAYYYSCQGNSDQVEANCRIYKSLQADNPGMPDCPYCN